MSIFLQIAFRNLLRNRKRSLITIAAVTLGLGAMIFLRSFIFGAQEQMVDNITSSLTGDAQIIPKALENIYNTNGAIEEPASIRQMLSQDRRVQDYSERIIAGGIVSSASNSMATFIVGFDPDQEAKINTRRAAVEGRLMTNDDQQGAALGEKMRQILGLEIGDKMIVTAQDYYGALAGGAYRLIGTFETGNDQIDNGTVMLLNPAASKLMSYDKQISKFIIKTVDKDDVEGLVQDLQKKLEGRDLKVATWEELIPMLSQLIRFENGIIFVVVMIVLAIVAAGILNTLMMSIVERTREFGLMMALGTKPSQVVILVALESFLLTTIGAFLGVFIGIGATLYFGHVGIDLSRFISTFSNFLVGSHVYPRIDWFYLILFLAVVSVLNVLVSLYPAWRAGKLVPIEAMRQVG